MGVYEFLHDWFNGLYFKDVPNFLATAMVYSDPIEVVSETFWSTRIEGEFHMVYLFYGWLILQFTSFEFFLFYLFSILFFCFLIMLCGVSIITKYQYYSIRLTTDTINLEEKSDSKQLDKNLEHFNENLDDDQDEDFDDTSEVDNIDADPDYLVNDDSIDDSIDDSVDDDSIDDSVDNQVYDSINVIDENNIDMIDFNDEKIDK